MALALLKKILMPSRAEYEAAADYADLVATSRKPEIYDAFGLPDTLDGRYESIVLHIFMAERKLPETAETMEYIRLLHEAFFRDMDRGLREGGVGDTGIGKRIKRMASGLYGRLHAYRSTAHDHDAFKQALLRNAYATCETPPTEQQIQAFIAYILPR